MFNTLLEAMNKTVSFESHRNLIKNLGESDAIAEFIEVAVRSFISQADKSGDFNNYLTRKSDEYSIRVNAVTQGRFRQDIAKGYMISVSQNIEQFLICLQYDYSDLFETQWGTLPDRTSRFDFVLRKLKQHEGIKLDETLVSVFKYYSFIRNSYAHGGKDDKKEFSIIKKHIEYIKEVYKLNAPNDFDRISFDDFILFTRISKDLASKMTEVMYKKISSNDLLLEYIVRMDLAKKYPSTNRRGFKALEGYVKAKFGLSPEYANYLVSSCAPLA